MGFNLTFATLVNQNTFHQKLEALDLEPIAWRLMHPEDGLGWSREQVTKAVTRYKMFLYVMHLYPNRAIIPTREMDIVWHFHILDTRKYAADCESLFGYFLHHRPGDGSIKSLADKAAIETAFASTLALFSEYCGLILSGETHNYQSAFVINIHDELQQASGCPDPINLLTLTE